MDRAAHCAVMPPICLADGLVSPVEDFPMQGPPPPTGRKLGRENTIPCPAWWFSVAAGGRRGGDNFHPLLPFNLPFTPSNATGRNGRKNRVTLAITAFHDTMQYTKNAGQIIRVPPSARKIPRSVFRTGRGIRRFPFIRQIWLFPHSGTWRGPGLPGPDRSPPHGGRRPSSRPRHHERRG